MNENNNQAIINVVNEEQDLGMEQMQENFEQNFNLTVILSFFLKLIIIFFMFESISSNLNMIALAYNL